MIIETKMPINPIYLFLIESREDQLKVEKYETLKAIDEFYNLSKVLPIDLEQIPFINLKVQTNREVLYDFCASKGKYYLLKVYGKSYSIKGPLGWRFKRGKHFIWLAQ